MEITVFNASLLGVDSNIYIVVGEFLAGIGGVDKYMDYANKQQDRMLSKM